MCWLRPSHAVQASAPRSSAGLVYAVPLTHFRKPAVVDFLREHPDALELSVLSTNFVCQLDTATKVAAALPVVAGVVAYFLAPAAAPFLLGSGVFGSLGVLSSVKPNKIAERLTGLHRLLAPLPLKRYLELKEVEDQDLIGLECEDGRALELASIAAGASFQEQPVTQLRQPTLARRGSGGSSVSYSRGSDAVGGGVGASGLAASTSGGSLRHRHTATRRQHEADTSGEPVTSGRPTNNGISQFTASKS
jgi:hypothetical protein